MASRENQISQAIISLKKGEIIALPTDTVYGLAVDAGNEDALKNLFDIKKRILEKALPLMIFSPAQLPSLVRYIPETAQDLIEIYWPGPLTIVLPRSDLISNLITGGTDKVAVRIPNHPLALRILQEFASPLAVTSANISGAEASLTYEEVEKLFGDRVDVIVKGQVEHGIVSTVVDCTMVPPKILRQGAVKILWL
jgi:L-threonylcarbamoyladenylate synthase